VQVVVGWYELAADGARRPRLDAPGDGAVAGEMTVPIAARPLDALALPNQANLAIAPALTLAAYELRSGAAQPGAPLVVDLALQAGPGQAPPPLALQLAAGGQAIELWRGDVAPGASWPADKLICRRIRTSLPLDVEPGNYQLVLAPPGQVAQAPTFHSLAVAPSTRSFAAPSMAMRVDARLGDAIQLLGYDLAQPANGGEPLVLELVWQATAAPQQSYTVFVHLLDQDGAIVAQSDALPGGGHATDQWLAGEVVIDAHQLVLPAGLAPGAYQLVAGMYHALSGERLPVAGLVGQPASKTFVQLEEIELH
jgi:hypothetical protein